MSKKIAFSAIFALAVGLTVGYLAGMRPISAAAQGQTGDAAQKEKIPSKGAQLQDESPAGFDANWDKAYPQYQKLGDVLKPYPAVKAGTIVPQRLYQYG